MCYRFWLTVYGFMNAFREINEMEAHLYATYKCGNF